MRSLLMAPAHEQNLAAALDSGADAIVVDLAQAAPGERAGARVAAAQFLKAARRLGGGPVLIVRANALDSGETDSDLDAAMAGAPDAILLPRSLGAASVQQLSAKLAVREAQLGLADGATRIIAVADAAQSLFHMASYRGSSARLAGVAWSAEALRADIGAETDRDRLGGALGPYRLARELTLLAATSARVSAIDTAFPDIRDMDGLRAEALAARRDGFAGKIALDPAQVGIINDVFPQRTMPDAESGA
jgi:citrate lyase subunit beta / citryl-CoA lyase